MKIAEVLTESFDSSYQIEGPHEENGRDIEYYFEVANDIVIMVRFERIDDLVYHLMFKDTLRGTGITDMTGPTAIKVFSTVVKCIKDFVNKYNPNEIEFAANSSEPSRIKLYDAIVNRLTNDRSHVTSKKPHRLIKSMIIYTITNKNPR